MENQDISAISRWLEHSAAAQLVFDGEILLSASAQALRYLPGVQIGDRAEKIFGEKAGDFLSYNGEGCLLFSMQRADELLNIKVAGWMDHVMVEITRDLSSLSASAMQTIADNIMEPMSTLMALSPKLLPQVPENEGNIQKAAMFNRSLYALMREAKNIQSAASMPESGSMKHTVNMTLWLEEFAEKLKPLCELADRKFTLIVPEKGPMCALEKDRLERALLNLISNAIKFTEKDGEITLRMNRLSSGRLRITIEDNGCGIAPDQMATVFDRKEHRKLIPDPREGAGLGLRVVRNIVMSHGGTLILESQEGRGTRVHITLESGEVSGQLFLRSQIITPVVSSGYDSMLVELSGVLPWEAYDPRGIDL